MGKHSCCFVLLICTILLISACRAAEPPSVTQAALPTQAPARAADPEASQQPAQARLKSGMQAELAGLDGLGFDQFLDESFTLLLRRDPQWVTELGLADSLGMDQTQLTDISAAYQEEMFLVQGAILERLQKFAPETLTGEQRLSAQIYAWYLQDQLDAYAFRLYDYPVNPILTGVQNQTVYFFTDLHPLTTLNQAQAYVQRLSQVDEKFAQLIEGLQARQAAGVVLPRFEIRIALQDITQIAGSPAAATPYYTSLAQKLPDIPGLSAADQQALLAAAEAAIEQSVLPAYRELAAFLKAQQAEASDEAGVWKFPQGEAYYAYVLRHHTSTDLSAEAIHEIGLQEVARIRQEIRQQFEALGYPANAGLAELFQRAAVDGGMTPAEDLVAAYEAIIADADQRMAAAFDLRPRAGVVVLPDPIGGFYTPPALDGSRPGAFYAGVNTDLPRYSLATLAYHEVIPGHHFQLALQGELVLPLFRRVTQFTAYAEGWALYAEKLAWELGFYTNDPYGNLGRLQAEAFRAARLVVDTGIHARRWTFEQAVDYMVENTGMPRGRMEYEVIRYIAWPGQATAYKIGMLKILALRQESQEQLGQDFNLKAFHNLVLGMGATPMEVLEAAVKASLTAQAAP